MKDRSKAAVLALAAAVSLCAVRSTWSMPPGLESLDDAKKEAYALEEVNFHSPDKSPRKVYAKLMRHGFPTQNYQSYVTEIRIVRSDDDKGAATALVTRYDYYSGLTFYSTVDLKNKKITDVTAKANGASPLGQRELEEATKLITNNYPNFKLTLEKIVYRALVNDAPDSQLYGHRLVVVWEDEPKRTPHFLVDLTRQVIANPDY